MFVTDIGIDLGTANVLIYIKGKGLVLREPTVVAIERKSKKIIAVGSEASDMIGRAPENIIVIKPLSQGVISDFSITEQMLKYFIIKIKGKRMRKPRISICVPSGVSEVERRAVEDAAYAAGAGKVRIVDEPIAAALGAGIDIYQACGRMIVDIGGGTTDVAVISLGGIVMSTSLKVAGDDFDLAIINYIRWKYNVIIGERTAERIKIEVGSVWERPENIEIKVKGRNLVTGLPKTLTITSDETIKTFTDVANKIVDAVYGILEKTPPELSADISQGGILMTGGGSLLHGMDKRIESKLGIFTVIADDPLTSVAKGLQYKI